MNIGSHKFNFARRQVFFVVRKKDFLFGMEMALCFGGWPEAFEEPKMPAAKKNFNSD